jgi:Zn finger protein HypA/HybF involved in hydrogenase expression
MAKEARFRNGTLFIPAKIICPHCNKDNARKTISEHGFSASCPDCKTRKRKMTSKEFDQWKEKQ